MKIKVVMIVILLMPFSLAAGRHRSSGAATESASFAADDGAGAGSADDLDLLGAGGDALGAATFADQVRALIDEQYASLGADVRAALKEKVIADGSQDDFVALLGTKKAQADDASGASAASEGDEPDPQRLIVDALAAIVKEMQGSSATQKKQYDEQFEYERNKWRWGLVVSILTAVATNAVQLGFNIAQANAAVENTTNCTG